MCLSRQVQWVAGPSMWNLPPAQLEEHSCIAHGDPYCEYRLRWFDGWRILPMILGLALGVVIGGIVQTMRGGVSAWLALPALGAALGHVFELRRMHALNLKLGKEMTHVLRELGQAEAETRSEIASSSSRWPSARRRSSESSTVSTASSSRASPRFAAFRTTFGIRSSSSEATRSFCAIG
jgi:hypothetical protein